MKSTVDFIRKKLERRKGALDQLNRDLEKHKRSLASVQTDLNNSLEAKEIIHHVAKLTQEELEYRISDIVSLALGGVFEEDIRLAVDFVSRRGKMEADMFFEADGKVQDPLYGDGGGAVDIGSLALRFSCWSLGSSKTRPVLVLDEPLKWLKGNDLPRRGAEMIKEISEKLGIQIIMVSHDPELIEGADRVIRVSQKNKVSIINQ